MALRSPAKVLRTLARFAAIAFLIGAVASCSENPPTEAGRDAATFRADHDPTLAALEISIDVRGGQQPAREWLISLIPSGGGAFGDSPEDLPEINPNPEEPLGAPVDFVQLTSGGTVTFQHLDPGPYTFIAREVAPLQGNEDPAQLREDLIRILTLEGSFTAAAPQLDGEDLTQVARFLATQVCLQKGNGKGVELKAASKGTLVDTGVLESGCLTLEAGKTLKLKLSPETRNTKQVDVFCSDLLSGDEAIGCSVYAMIKLADEFGEAGAPSQCQAFDGEFDTKAHCGLVAAWGSSSGSNDPVTLTLPITTDPDFIEFETVIDLGNGVQQSASFATEITNSTNEVSLESSLLVCELFDRSGDDAVDPEVLGDAPAGTADIYALEDGPIAEVDAGGFVVFDNDEGSDKEYMVRFNVFNGDGTSGTLLMQFDAPGGGTLSMNVDFSIDVDDLDGNGQFCDAIASGGAVNAGIFVRAFGSLLPGGDVLCTFIFIGIDPAIVSAGYKIQMPDGEQYPNSSKETGSRQPISLNLPDGASCENSPIFGDSRFGGIIGSRFGGIIG